MSESRKIKNKCNARKKNFNNKNLMFSKKTKKQVNQNKQNNNIQIQKGGSGNGSNNRRDNFEVTAWHDINFDKISLVKNANVDWGDSAFGIMTPPTDCIIM